MGINAHIPRTSRFVIGVRASTRHISASLRIPDGLRVTFTPQTFVKEVIHATGQADIFGHVPGRAQANNTVWADRLLICSGNGVTLIIIFLRLLFAVPGEGRLQRNVLTYLPAQGRVKRVLWNNRQAFAGLFVFTLQHIRNVIRPVDGVANGTFNVPSRPSTTAFGTFSH